MEKNDSGVKIFPGDFRSEIKKLAMFYQRLLKVGKKYSPKNLSKLFYRFFSNDTPMTLPVKILIFRGSKDCGSKDVSRISTLQRELIDYLHAWGYIKNGGGDYFLKAVTTVKALNNGKMYHVKLKFPMNRALRVKNALVQREQQQQYLISKNSHGTISVGEGTKILSFKER